MERIEKGARTELVSRMIVKAKNKTKEDRACVCGAGHAGQHSEKKTNGTRAPKGELMGVYRKMRRLGLMTMNDCECKRTDKEGPNVRIFVLQSVRNKTPRRRMGGLMGRDERTWESAEEMGSD